MSPAEPNRPPRVTPQILAAPKAGQLYWCRLWNEAELPEFHKTRPALVIAHTNSLNGHATILPATTIAQPGNRWARRISTSLNRKETWVICSHPQSVATSRFLLQRRIPTVTEEEMQEIRRLLAKWLHIEQGG